MAQPDTEIIVVRRASEFVFVGNQPDNGFECALDGATPSPCRAPYAVGALRPGAHTFSVAMRDRYGTLDATPDTVAWTIDPPAPPPPAPLPQPLPAPPDGDGDGVPDARDNCPAVVNAAQGDGDGDGVGDACEVGSPGTLPPVAGERVNVEVVSGDVFVKFPAATRALMQQESGFVPLKGRASVPVGSTVDARKGTVAMSSAENAAGTARSAAAERRHLPHPPAARQGRVERSGLDRPGAPEPSGRRGRVRALEPLRPDQGPLAQHDPQPDGRDDQGPVPGRRRRRDHDGTRRDVGHARSLRRDADRGRPRPRVRARPRHARDDPRARGPLVPGEGEAVRREAGTMRALLLAVVLATLWAAPAAAQFQPPTVIKFAAGQQMPISDGGATLDAGCGGATIATGGWNGGAFLRLPANECEMRLALSLPPRQASVELFVRAPKGTRIDLSLCGPQFCDPDIVAEGTIASATGEWQPLVVATRRRRANHLRRLPVLDRGRCRGRRHRLLGRSPARHADHGDDRVRHLADDRRRSRSTRAPLRSRTGAPIDRGEFAECSNPASFAGLAPGAHTLSVFAVDDYGASDVRTPARADFVVNPPNPTNPPPADADRDGVPDSADNCPANANSDQADADADGVGNACDVLPPGNVPPQPGETSVVQVVSGEVFVKLPTRTALGFDGMRAPFQDGGFLPLKGVASIPLGSTVDTRKGEVVDRVRGQQLRARRPPRQAAGGPDQGRACS